jgi:hypothetical protein
METSNPLLRWVWPLLASLAGAITALSFRPYRNLRPIEIVLALFVGSTFAVFVGPMVAYLLFGKGPVDVRLLGGLLYVMASGSNVLIPLAIKKLSKRLGLEDNQ